MEINQGLHMVFIDLEMAYNRVPRKDAWRCLGKQVVAENYVHLVKDPNECEGIQVKNSAGITVKIT